VKTNAQLGKIPAKPPKITLKTVAKTSVCEDVARQILKLIAKGELKPGQRLPPERDLCANFGVGRSSLREALRCLSIVGVLDARVGEGTSVASNGGKFVGKIFEWRLEAEQHDLEHLIDVRIALEGAGAADVARNGTNEQLEMLRGLLKEMKKAINDPKIFADLDMEFHVQIASASGNPLLYDLISTIRNQLSNSVQQFLTLPGARPHSSREHLAIFEQIERRDPNGARAAMETHLQSAMDRYRTEVEDPAKRLSK
jgi:GntR family transcriptional repressor for pyruvate dehydrogenase complex